MLGEVRVSPWPGGLATLPMQSGLPDLIHVTEIYNIIKKEPFAYVNCGNSLLPWYFVLTGQTVKIGIICKYLIC